MDSALIASSTNTLISEWKTLLGANFDIVLAFAAGIVVWQILKKYVFRGASRV